MRKFRIYKEFLFFITCIALLIFSGCTSVQLDTKEQNLQLNQEGKLEVHFVDVGQGQAQIIITPSHRVMVIDGGNNDDEQTMVDYLHALGVTEIDVLIGTHPDADHIGGIDAVIDAFDVRDFYMPPISVTTDTFKSVLASAKAKNLTIQTAQKDVQLNLDSSCDTKMIAPIQMSKDSNEMSVVVKMACGKSSYLFTGDIEEEAEKALLNSHENIDVDVLLIPHHGSNGSTSQAFLNKVTPKIGVIQSGKGNSYGHPHEETLERLEKAGREIYRTDQLGHIVIASDLQSGTYTVNEKTGKPKKQTTKKQIKQISAFATVSNSTPNQNEEEIVTVIVTDEQGNPVSEADVELTLFFSSKETVYSAVTNPSGKAMFHFKIGRAKSGYNVRGQLEIQKDTHKTTTEISFTPS